jgi:hypothetical protein
MPAIPLLLRKPEVRRSNLRLQSFRQIAVSALADDLP